jgi:hypothetical protein
MRTNRSQLYVFTDRYADRRLFGRQRRRVAEETRKWARLTCGRHDRWWLEGRNTNDDDTLNSPLLGGVSGDRRDA